MDCVGCDKCKLWGKLQVQGVGTALKVLFAGRKNGRPLYLTRMEIISLFNVLGRYVCNATNIATEKSCWWRFSAVSITKISVVDFPTKWFSGSDSVVYYYLRATLIIFFLAQSGCGYQSRPAAINFE